MGEGGREGGRGGEEGVCECEGGKEMGGCDGGRKGDKEEDGQGVNMYITD